MQGLRGVIGMRSSLYFGEVRHHRRSPKKHDLRYKLYMPHLFLDEVNEVFKDRWLWSVDRSNLSSFQRKDYHAPQKPSLEDAVRETISEQTGSAIHGPVSVLTHLRTFGHCFNPVTFYYVWDPQKTQPNALLVEITNTPWGERYAKAFRWADSDTNGSTKSKHRFEKEFHVSPFIGMNVNYDWRFSLPGDDLKVDMVLRENDRVFFTAHLDLNRKPFGSGNLAWALLRFPFLTFKVTFGIYWNALLLRLKGCPFYSHPKHLNNSSTHEQASN